MIKGYAEHAANERTFLAWVRTGIAVIAFGLLIEKLDLAIRAASLDAATGTVGRLQAASSTQQVWRYDGMALLVLGLAIILLQTARFARISRMLDDVEPHHVGRSAVDVIFSTVLTALIAVFTTYVLLA